MKSKFSQEKDFQKLMLAVLGQALIDYLSSHEVEDEETLTFLSRYATIRKRLENLKSKKDAVKWMRSIERAMGR